MAREASRKWYGNPHVTARIPRDHWHAIRAEARRRNCIPSVVIRDIVAQWVHDGHSVHTANETVAPVALPTPVATWEGKQRAEPTRRLVAIDKQRDAVRDAGNAYAD